MRPAAWLGSIVSARATHCATCGAMLATGPRRKGRERVLASWCAWCESNQPRMPWGGRYLERGDDGEVVLGAGP